MCAQVNMNALIDTAAQEPVQPVCMNKYACLFIRTHTQPHTHPSPHSHALTHTRTSAYINSPHVWPPQSNHHLALARLPPPQWEGVSTPCRLVVLKALQQDSHPSRRPLPRSVCVWYVVCLLCVCVSVCVRVCVCGVVAGGGFAWVCVSVVV